METRLLTPLPPSNWTPRHARHLLNRAGFGLTHERAESLAALRPEEAVRRMVEYDADLPETPGFLISIAEDQRRRELATLDEDERRQRQQELRRQEREAIEELKAWWLQQIVKTRSPLQEKMTLFWHGHFATSAQKVRSSAYTYRLNEVFRRNAAGNFKKLTIEVGQSPSMLRYLDNVQSTRKQPNENWARELMELFTMGQKHYTELDIKESARAFTGWILESGEFAYREDNHDPGSKVFMGRQGTLDGWDIIDIIFEQPSTAEFICTKLWRFFAYEEPEHEIVVELAEVLRANNYELKPVLTRLFASAAFYSDKAMGWQIKSPVQFLVQLASDLEMTSPPYSQMARAAAQLGQNLFYPPNVKGWDGNRAWINANSLLMRYNMPGALVLASADKSGRMMNDLQKASPNPPVAAMSDSKPASAPEPVWTPQVLFAQLDFSTAGACVEALEGHFLAVPLNGEQRELLIRALGASSGDAPLSPAALNPPSVRAAMHLLLSTAEYQLC